MASESYEDTTHLDQFQNLRSPAHSLFSRITEPAARKTDYDELVASINAQETGSVWMSVSLFVSIFVALSLYLMSRVALVLPGIARFLWTVGSGYVPDDIISLDGESVTALYRTMTTAQVTLEQGAEAIMNGLELLPPFFWELVSVLFIPLVLAVMLLYPVYIRGERGRSVDAGYFKVILHMRALSAGGMSGGKIFESVARSADVYGACAKEFARVHNVATRADGSIEEGILNVRESTSSTKVEEFLDGYLRTLKVGGSERDYIAQQAESVIEEREANIERFANFIQYASLGYIVGLIVAPIVIIAVFGALAVRGQSYQGIAQAIVYFIVPLFSTGVMVSIKVISGSQNIDAKQTTNRRDYTEFLTTRPDLSGVKYAFYKYIDKPSDTEDSTKEFIESLFVSPERVLAFTIPLGALYAAIGVFTGFGPDPLVNYYTISLHLFGIPYLIAVVPMSLVHEYERRRVIAIRRNLPTVFNNIADANQQGLTLTEAIGVASGDSSTLRTELTNTVRQAEITNNLNTSLNDLATRIRSDELLRSTKLLVQANELSANVQSTISVIARNLERQYGIAQERRNSSVKYIFLIIISFIMSLYMTFVVDELFFNRLSKQLEQISQDVGNAGVSDSDVLFYRRLFLHSTLSISLTAGYFIGVIKSGSLLEGAKYTIALVIITLVFFNTLIV